MRASDASSGATSDDGDSGSNGGGGRTVTPNDGGVLRRLVRRSVTGAAVLEIVGVALIAAAVLLPWGLVAGTAALLAVAVIGIGAVMAVRAVFWAGMASSPEPLEAGAVGVVGPVTALSPTRPGAPLRRKLTAAVIPIAVGGGPQPGGGALLIHARTDGTALTEGDDIEVWRGTRKGPGALAGDGRQAITGRFVLRRTSDGAVFIGSSRLTDVL